MSKFFALRGAVKNYDWGKLGSNSSVASFHKASFPESEINEDMSYAELWMGTHLSGHSVIPSKNGITLFEYLEKHPENLGSCIRTCSNKVGLPFLFKVLSIRKSLSIQVHPDKPTAEILHRKYSDLYPDDNHKPELAIALTSFQALCGFRPVAEIKAFVLELSQLQEIIGEETTSDFLNSEEAYVDILKNVFISVITCSSDKSKQYLDDLVDYFSTNSCLSDLCKSVKDSFLTIHREYPGDAGCFCIFFLNILNLSPGEAIFLAANEPHAYLKGDCIECMACSDNVVRAGLTPKYKDVVTLCDLLTYQCKSANENIFPFRLDADLHVITYDPPVPEFAVARIVIGTDDSTYNLAVLQSASILIVVEGEAVASDLNESESIPLHPGSIIFISSDTALFVRNPSSKITMYRAYCSG